jgi:hypothetical protein
MLLRAIKRVLFGRLTEGLQDVHTPAGKSARFELFYRDLPIGWLELRDGRWSFEYTSVFRNQTEVNPLVDFPDVRKVYVTEDLWPFFVSRIPSLAQPQVQETIEKEGLDGHSNVDLLKRFGERTISNPFVLTYQS